MFRKILTGIAMLALLAPIASIASAQTVDELIAKNIEAKGGKDKLKAVKSSRTTGKMTMGQYEIPMTMVQKRPDRFRLEFSFQGMTAIQAYDGKTAWGSMPMMGKKEPEVMGEDETKAAEEQADMDGPLMDYKQKGNTVELIGKEQVEGADAYKIKCTLKNGEERYIYLDAETYLDIKNEAKRKIRGNEVESESYMSDYKEVSGMMVPFSIENGVKGSPQRQKLVLEKVELNVDLPDSLFALPANAVKPDTTTAAKPAAGKDAAKPATAPTSQTAKAAKPDSATTAKTKKKP
jgi:outer membrane lipoprotein-sorting protein